ncbi:hypothetical protein B0H13DRAFT_1912242 [Mycena leptocephala]|nr:hypothetical protein B0H13DRAFT_1912242 [Mycena leptocephala]
MPEDTHADRRFVPSWFFVDPAWSWSREIVGFDPCGLYLVYWQYHGAFRTRNTMPCWPGVEPNLFNTFLLVLVFGGSSRGQCLARELLECLNLIVRIRIRTSCCVAGPAIMSMWFLAERTSVEIAMKGQHKWLVAKEQRLNHQMDEEGEEIHTYTVNLDALPDLAKCEGHPTLQRTQHTILANRRPNVHGAMFEPFALLSVIG